jgi:hypothetical protein
MSLTSVLLIARYNRCPAALATTTLRMAGGRGKRAAVANGSEPAAKKTAAAAANGSSQPAAKKNKTETDWDGVDFTSTAKGKNGDS